MIDKILFTALLTAFVSVFLTKLIPDEYEKCGNFFAILGMASFLVLVICAFVYIWK